MLALAATTPVAALTGTELLKECQKSLQPTEASACLAYIVGFTEGYEDGYTDQGLTIIASTKDRKSINLLQQAVPSSAFRLPMCLPAVVTYPQLRDVFLAFAKAKPDYLKKNARGILVDAFMSAYPCPAGKLKE